jgi:hypothetical protein
MKILEHKIHMAAQVPRVPVTSRDTAASGWPDLDTNSCDLDRPVSGGQEEDAMVVRMVASFSESERSTENTLICIIVHL